MQDFLIDDEPCIDIVRSVYELECTVSEFKKRIILQHISYCHSDECDDTKHYDEEMIPPLFGGLKLN